MNENTVEGGWKQIKGKVMEEWGRLTNDDIELIAGKRDQLIGRLQERYGMAQETAEHRIRDFERRHALAKSSR